MELQDACSSLRKRLLSRPLAETGTNWQIAGATHGHPRPPKLLPAIMMRHERIREHRQVMPHGLRQGVEGPPNVRV